MNAAHTESFKQLKFRPFELMANTEQLLETIRKYFTSENLRCTNIGDLIEVRTLENPLPLAGQNYAISLHEQTNPAAIPSSYWFEYCTLARLSADIAGQSLQAIQGGMLSIALARTFKDKHFIPYDRNIVAFFKNKNDADEFTAVRFTLHLKDESERFNMTYEACDFISPRDLVICIWKI